MALFKILRGLDEDLSKQPLRDGYAYFLKKNHYFAIDHLDASGTLVRSKISAEYADKLRFTQDGETVEINSEDIATKSYVQEIETNVKEYVDTAVANAIGALAKAEEVSV